MNPTTAHGRREGAQLIARLLLRCVPEEREQAAKNVVVGYRRLLDETFPNLDAAKLDDAAQRFREMIEVELVALIMADDGATLH